MSKANVRRHILEKNRSPKEKEPKPTQSLLSKHLKKVYPIGLHRSSSSLSLSSLSLSLSQNSNDSSVTDNSHSPLEQRISLALRLITPPERREVTVAKNVQPQQQQQQQQQQSQDSCCGELKRCNWITKNSGKLHLLSTKSWFERIIVNTTCFRFFHGDSFFYVIIIQEKSFLVAKLWHCCSG